MIRQQLTHSRLPLTRCKKDRRGRGGGKEIMETRERHYFYYSSFFISILRQRALRGKRGGGVATTFPSRHFPTTKGSIAKGKEKEKRGGVNFCVSRCFHTLCEEEKEEGGGEEIRAKQGTDYSSSL